MSDLDDRVQREALTELRDGQRALLAAVTSHHLETNTRLARVEERLQQARADDLDIKARLSRVETAEHVSVDWMKKVEQRTEMNQERIEGLAQQRGFLVGAAAALAWLLGLLASAAKAWLPAMGK